MSYSAIVGGHLKIDPPLKWSEIRDSRFFVEGGSGSSRQDPDVVFRVSREDIETDEGVSTVFTSRFAVPYRQETSFDCRALAEDCEELLQEMKKIGRTLSGELVVQPRDYGDGGIWRVVADEGGVRKEDAKLQWPDGSEVELP